MNHSLGILHLLNKRLKRIPFTVVGNLKVGLELVHHRLLIEHATPKAAGTTATTAATTTTAAATAKAAATATKATAATAKPTAATRLGHYCSSGQAHQGNPCHR